MQLGADTSVTTTDLIGLTRFKANADDSQFPAAEVKGLLNIAQRELQTKILEYMDSWDFNGQIATADLVADQREYNWPTDLLAIKRMDVLLDGTNSQHATIVDTATLQNPLMNEDDFRTAFGNSVVYDPFDEGFNLFTGAPIISVTDGIRIEYSEQIVDLVGTADEPLFVEAYQPWLSMHAAKAFFDRYEQPNKAQRVMNEMLQMEASIAKYYARRSREDSQRPRMTTNKRRSSWHYQ